MELSYLDIAIKLTMGLLSLVLVINISGKGNNKENKLLLIHNKAAKLENKF